MKLKITKDNPHAKVGAVITVSTPVGLSLVKDGIAEEFKPNLDKEVKPEK